MGVRSTDSVFIISDRETVTLGELLAQEASRQTAEVRLRLLEEFEPRPITSLPEVLRSDLLASRPTVTFFAATGQAGEITFRLGLGVFLRNDLNVRHAHMVGITPELMAGGMLADYDLVWYVTHHVYERVRIARVVHVTSQEGTDLEAHFASWMRWVPCDGRYHDPGDWGNLPEGETFTCPETVNGVLVARVLGDHFSDRYGVLSQPITFEIANSLIVDIKCPNRRIGSEVKAYLEAVENGRRVGEFAIGTNIAIKELSGNLLQDEKIPGVHLAFGHPFPEETGARWASPVHLDAVAPFCSVIVDGHELLGDGRFVGLPADIAAQIYGPDRLDLP
jgi:leucyl aminopeptidase (aminopeptidase T)